MGADREEDEKKWIACWGTGEIYASIARVINKGVPLEEAREQVLSNIKSDNPLRGYMSAVMDHFERDEPSDLDRFVRNNVARCVAESGLDADGEHVGQCHQITLYANQMFKGKAEGMSETDMKSANRDVLDHLRVSDVYIKRVETMVGEVYRTDLKPSKYRLRYYKECSINPDRTWY